jgi:hypothetical protein
MLDSNQRPLGYEPNELPTAPIRDTKLQIFHLKQNFKKGELPHPYKPLSVRPLHTPYYRSLNSYR